MLFKTLSASVYGIDAYLVEVEVDVGSARMTDFNVAGLPDNAVKESRERIKTRAIGKVILLTSNNKIPFDYPSVLGEKEVHPN